MQGQRYDDVSDLSQKHKSMEPGGYRRVHSGTTHGWLWECSTPNGLLGNLERHEVTEHDDGTITVTPSILVDEPPEQTWHGYLEKGVWREV